MKMFKLPSVEEPQSMSAMTDVVFLLLIFFIVTMSSYIEMTLLETNLPTSAGQSSKVDLQNHLKIVLTEKDQYVINGIVQNRASLDRLLRRYARLMPEAEFLLQCDPEMRHHTLVTLLGDLSKYGLKNIKLLK